MMIERGVDLAHTRIVRWIQRYVVEFEKRWSRLACKAWRSWRVDETYVKIKGDWTYLYREPISSIPDSSTRKTPLSKSIGVP